MTKAANGNGHVPHALSDILKGTDYALTIFTDAEIKALKLLDKGDKPYLKCWATDKDRLALPNHPDDGPPSLPACPLLR